MDIKIQRSKPLVGEEEKQAALRVLSNNFYINGPELKAFEAEFATFCGVRHAAGVSSGTTALVAALIAWGVGKGDEVIVPPNSFMATANAIELVGAKSVFVDINEESYNIDPTKIEKAITSKTKVIIPVHLYGQMADMDRIMEIARKHNLKVLEDACQAHGAEYKGKKAGSIGDAAVFSFFPTKNMTVAGDGGAVVSNNEEFMEKVRMIRNAGWKTNKDNGELFGFNFRLTEIPAAIGRVQLKKLEGWTARRREIAALYNNKLGGVVRTPKEMPYGKHVYHLYTIRVRRRDELRDYLRAKGIESTIMYSVPTYLMTSFVNKYGYKAGLCPVEEKTVKEILSIPMHPGLSASDIDLVIKTVKEFK